MANTYTIDRAALNRFVAFERGRSIHKVPEGYAKTMRDVRESCGLEPLTEDDLWAYWNRDTATSYVKLAAETFEPAVGDPDGYHMAEGLRAHMDITGTYNADDAACWLEDAYPVKVVG